MTLSEALSAKAPPRVSPISPILHPLRLIKSPAEMSLMKEAGRIAGCAFEFAMKQTRPGSPEYTIAASLEYQYRTLGAQRPSFPHVVAGGSRANTLHYISNDQLLQAGSLVLVDSGCEYHGYTSDISRTWPVSGKFSAAQRRLYEAVLHVQKECIKVRLFIDY